MVRITSGILKLAVVSSNKGWKEALKKEGNKEIAKDKDEHLEL